MYLALIAPFDWGVAQGGHGGQKQHTIRDTFISHLTEAQCKPAFHASHRIALSILFVGAFLSSSYSCYTSSLLLLFPIPLACFSFAFLSLTD